jgi:hypothetical protein
VPSDDDADETACTPQARDIPRRHVVGILRACRPVFAGSPELRGDFDTLCDGLMEWLEAEIAPARFARTQ